MTVGDRTLRLVVDDGGTAVPAIISWATENDVELVKAEVYAPPFDDIFVELVETLTSEDDEVPADTREAAV